MARGFGASFSKDPMRSRVEVIAEVSLQNPFQMPFSEHDHVIEAFSANTSNEPFREWILPGTFRCSEHLLDSHSLNPVSEITTVHPVTVTDQISWCSIFRKRFDNLLRGPFCSGMVGDIEMQHTPTLVRQYDENKQHLQLHCGNSKEVNGDQLTDVVGQKRLPCLRGVFA